MSYWNKKAPWEKLPKELRLKFTQTLTKYFDAKRKANRALDQLADALGQDPYDLQDALADWEDENFIDPVQVYEEVR